VNYLLDTHLLVWTAHEPERLSQVASELIADPGNALYFSVIGIWEVAIKQSLGRASFTVDAPILRRGLLSNGFRELPLTSAHALEILHLPPIHQDPFDRILVAQAISEDITLLTTDSMVARYPGPIRKV